MTKGIFFSMAKINKAYSHGEYNQGSSCYFCFKIKDFKYNVHMYTHNKQSFLIDDGESIIFETDNEYEFLHILNLIKKEAINNNRRLEKTKQWNTILKNFN